MPASSEVLCLYATYLARRLSFASVKVYLNVIRIIHLECNLKNPLDDFKLTCLVQGIKRKKGDRQNRKLPITPEILMKICGTLDLNRELDSLVWAVALVSFFGMLRRSNVLPLCSAKFDQAKHLRRQDVTFSASAVTLHIRWAKNIQFQERDRFLPLARIPGHTLCPVVAAHRAFQMTADCPPSGPAFGTLSSQVFVRRIREALTAAGYEAGQFATHSFRRGGATFAHACGVPVQSIKIIGDWHSDCFEKYIFESVGHVSKIMVTISEAVAKNH